MKAVLRNILSVLLAAVVISTTSGFAVYKHHCDTQSITEYSLLVPAFDCEHYNHGYSGDLPPCCATHNTDKEESSTNDDCCKTDSYIVKLEITTINHDISHKLHFDTYVEPVLSYDVLVQFSDEISDIIISSDLPPPKSGKAIRICMHQLNIPYPSV